MKLRYIFLFILVTLITSVTVTTAQVDSAIGQFTSSGFESFAGGMSGNGRFVVFESRANIATENPRNSDSNVEIFLFDYAQRRIFQITDTKSVLFNPTQPTSFPNIRVDIVNTRPVISNDGRWIAFSSNATTSTPTAPDSTNPGNFDGNAFTAPTPTPSPSPSPSPTPTPGANPLTGDGNLEMWIYEIPPYAPADLSTGEELPITTLSGGNFIRVTNTLPSQLPRAGTTSTGPFIAEDNHDASISDDGNVIAFVSTRDLVPSIGNAPPPPLPGEDNDEIFTFVRASSLLGQVTKTPRGAISNPIYNKNPTIAGDGSRVVFASTGDNPIVGMTGGNNPLESRNEEIFFTDLDATASPTGVKKQLTVTTPTNPGDLVNILDLGRRMSRDGRYIAFDSYADLANEHSGANQTSFALYLYDLTTPATPTVRRIAPRSMADSGAAGGDLARYPGFTDYDDSGTPTTLVLETRMNITPAGTIPTNQDDGLNPNTFRPAQLYSYPLDVPPAAATFTRLAKFPTPNTFLASVQALPSNSVRRIAFNMGLTEVGTGNPDLLSEVYYLLQPVAHSQTPASVNFATGASRWPVSLTPVPTPVPTPSPSPSPSPSPTPVVVTPPAVHGISPGMLTILNYDPSAEQPIIPRTAVGSIMRSFMLPIELSGLTLTINGVACGLKSVDQRKIVFVAPPFLSSVVGGTSYPVVINNNGRVSKTTITIVPARPDIFNKLGVAPGGRAEIYNVTNRVARPEPFATHTILVKGGRRVPSVLRLYLTGVANVGASSIDIRIGTVDVPDADIITPAVLRAPGVYSIDFRLPASLRGAGDQPIVVTVNAGAASFVSRLADTAPRLSIL